MHGEKTAAPVHVLCPIRQPGMCNCIGNLTELNPGTGCGPIISGHVLPWPGDGMGWPRMAACSDLDMTCSLPGLYMTTSEKNGYSPKHLKEKTVVKRVSQT
jgi:hypothetical protein